MNTKITISKVIYPVLFSAVMLFVTSSAFAQVKIGTSPTVIGPNLNLEIEATDGSKTTANKTSGQFTVTTTADPVKFVGLQLGTGAAYKNLIVDPANGTVKYANVPIQAIGLQVSLNQSFNYSAFGVSSNTNPAQLTFGPGDVVFNTGIATVAGNILTITEAGFYEIHAQCNIGFGGSPWNSTGAVGMAINLTVQRQVSGGTSWESISGARTFFPYGWLYAHTCQTSSATSLNVGDQVRVIIFRGNGDYLTGGAASTGDSVNGVPYTKALRLTKIQ